MPSQFNDLPHEVLHIIFDLINLSQYASLRSVNTVWNSLLSPYVFNSVTIFNYFRKKRTLGSILDDMEHSLAEMTAEKQTFRIPIGHHIQHLALLYDDTTGNQLQRLPFLCPNITSFTIASKIMDNISPEGLSSQNRHGHHRRHHQPLRQHIDQSAVGDLDTRRALLVDFFKSLGGPKMTKLRLEETSSYPTLIEVILPFFSHLVELDISSVVWKSDYDFAQEPFVEPFVDTIDMLNLIQNSCPKLKALSMAKRGFSTVEQDLGVTSSDGLASWVSDIQVWPHLTSLHLKLNITQPCSRLWLVPALMYLAVRLPGLQHLQMTAGINSRIQDHSTLPKDEQLAYLLRAGLCDTSSGERRTRSYFFTGLRSINLEGIRLGFLEKLVLFGYDEFMEGSTTTPSVKSIELRNSSTTYERQNDSTVSPQHSFLRYCISQNPLTSLKLQHCGFADKHLLDCLAFGTNQLETLNIDRFTVCLDSILDWCPHLQHLGLKGCNVYGSTNREASAETTTTTQALTISSASASASAIEDQCHLLKVLDLTRAKVKDTGVFGLISQRCRQLSVLHLEGIAIYDRTTTKGKTSQPCNETKHVNDLERLGAHIYMPYTKLSLCTFGGNAGYYGHRFKKIIMNVLLFPFTETMTDYGPGALWLSLQEGLSSYDVISLGKYSQKVLDKMASLDDGSGDVSDDGNYGNFGFGLDDKCLRMMKKNGLLTIQCKDIQEMVIAGHSYYSPFGKL